VVKGVDGLLKDATRPSRVKPLAPEMIKRVVHMTLHEKPPNATQWSVRIMAKVAGISYSSIQRIWLAHGLKPHLVKTLHAAPSAPRVPALSQADRSEDPGSRRSTGPSPACLEGGRDCGGSGQEPAHGATKGPSVDPAVFLFRSGARVI
jgi:hypothetical protein